MTSVVPMTASRRALDVLNNSAMVRHSVGDAVTTARDGTRTAGQFPGQSEVTSNLFERVVRHSAKLGADVDDVLVRGAGGQADIQALHAVRP